jgi:uncharacterized protein (TIGR00297 family)
LSGTSLLVGGLLAAAIAFGAYLLGSLSTSGALGAILVGTLTFGVGGVIPAALLILFFVSSSALSRLGKSHKLSVAAAFAKGSRRDLGQVLANGSMAAALSVAYGVTGQPLWLAGVVGALAAVTADTWATELGVLSGRRPRLITSGQPVDPGTSGGVSLEGTLAATAGAVLIGLAASVLSGEWSLVGLAALGGVAGSMIDSLLGATVQAIYWCSACNKETERYPLHTCGTPTTSHRGWHWLGNDAVNLTASLVGAGVLVLIFALR